MATTSAPADVPADTRGEDKSSLAFLDPTSKMDDDGDGIPNALDPNPNVSNVSNNIDINQL